MPNHSDQRLLERYLLDIKEIKTEFINTIRFSQSLIIVLNSGGIVALVDFFTNQKLPPILIKFAAVLFVLGVIFGILTLLGDFLCGYFLFTNLLKIKNNELLVKYYSEVEQEDIFNKMRKELYTLIIFGFISPMLWLLGVGCIFAYILNVKCPLAILLFFILLIVGLGYFLFYRLKSKIEWHSKEN